MTLGITLKADGAGGLPAAHIWTGGAAASVVRGRSTGTRHGTECPPVTTNGSHGTEPRRDLK